MISHETSIKIIVCTVREKNKQETGSNRLSVSTVAEQLRGRYGPEKQPFHRNPRGEGQRHNMLQADPFAVLSQSLVLPQRSF